MDRTVICKALDTLLSALWTSGRQALNRKHWVFTPKVVKAGNLLAALLAASSATADMATLQAAVAS